MNIPVIPPGQPIPWRASCIQMSSVPVAPYIGTSEVRSIIAANVQRAVRMVETCCDSATPPRLVVLPEFAFQGPPHATSIANWIEQACDSLPGTASEPLQALAHKRNLYIAGNLFERDARWPGRFFNSSFLIDPSGQIVLRYRRINTALWPSPHDFMDAYLDAYGIEGTFPVVDTPLGRLAVVACGEISVPEVTRCFMMRGAEVLLHPTNEEYSPGQEAAKIARASENMMYVISANVAGAIGFSLDGSVTGGRSRIIDYRGATLAYESDACESTGVSAMVDVEQLRAARHDVGLGNTLLRCRWEMYRPLLADAAFYPPNQFLAAPMPDSSATRPVSQLALQNLERAGVAAPVRSNLNSGV